ncbi:probable GPI anchored protein [Cephalotrichum gorgonifer]|uniref:Probable GPI anchored protein n=1 Tax=Cephalotrichum gorgonifer TaxID=2041049 RepID=A0AAE8MYB8_9PEZI|nr:probable GPI anchored protein [Cephalotrichum gorgonifer]
MRLNQTALAFIGATLAHALPSSHQGHSSAPSCRFALDWPQKEVLKNTDKFIWDLLYWEGKFHQNDISYNTANGMSYDGVQLDWVTGDATEVHTFSAASKEALQIMLYSHAIAGSKEAARFLTPDKPQDAPAFAASIMETKLKTYLRFNETYPGFGGFLPWMTTSNQDVSPTTDWENRVPGLDNGELLWAVYAVIQALEKSHNKSFLKLAEGWQAWLDYTKSTAPKIFHLGGGRVCAVIAIADQTLAVDDPKQEYSCEGDSLLDDPYEGELLTYFIHHFSNLSDADKESLWEVKRAKLRSVEYHKGGVGPITVQEGYWFSSHEPWKVLEMPFFDVDIVRRIYHNAERARTCNSVVTGIPGLYASVNNSTDPETDAIMGYISPAGIPSISVRNDSYLDVITPYGAWPTIMFNKSVGLAWWRNMAAGKKMQNPFGSTESTRVDGELISALVTWDSKVTTVVALLGGVGDLVREKMKADGIYDEFIRITEREHTRVFKELKVIYLLREQKYLEKEELDIEEVLFILQI